jgi:hypothetical protein
MPSGWVRLTHHDDNHVLSESNISVPSREQPCAPESSAPTHLVGLDERLPDLLPVSRKEIWMSLGDVALSLLRELNLALQVRARETAHRLPSIRAPNDNQAAAPLYSPTKVPFELGFRLIHGRCPTGTSIAECVVASNATSSSATAASSLCAS